MREFFFLSFMNKNFILVPDILERENAL